MIFGAFDKNSYDKQGGAGPFSPTTESLGADVAAAEAVGAVGAAKAAGPKQTCPSDPRSAGSGKNVPPLPAPQAAAVPRDSDVVVTFDRAGSVRAKSAAITDDSAPISRVGFASDHARYSSTFECINAINLRIANTDSSDSSTLRANDVWFDAS